MSSAAGGYGGDESQLLHHHYQPHNPGGQLYHLAHVPQHSRREKLRFPPDDSPLPSPPQPLLLHDPSAAQPLFYSATHFLSSSSASYCSGFSSPPTQLAGSSTVGGTLLPQAAASQGFSLSLSSSSNPPPALGPRRPFGGAGPAVSGPYGPFTGYAAVLSRPRFLGPARQLLEEICDVGRRAAAAAGGGQGGDGSGDEGLMEAADPAESSLASAGQEVEAAAGAEQQWKKTRLISMMEEVCKRYKQYYQQVQAVIASFESVAGLSNATPSAAMALRAMSRHFKCLKNSILNQLRSSNKIDGKELGINKDDMPSFRLSTGGGCLQRMNNVISSYGQPQIWRPQRGLPERAVAVLRTWLFEHFLHPYPTDTDKHMLAKQTGLTRNQVSNWFINARVRLWKPMVEEIHNLEHRESQKKHSPGDRSRIGVQQSQQQSDCSGSRSDLQPSQSSGCTSIQDGLPQIHNIVEPINFIYDGLSGHDQHVGLLPAVVAAGGNGGVSLTLGLHQNNRICMAEPLPASLVHRFGLDDCTDAYVGLI